MDLNHLIPNHLIPDTTVQLRGAPATATASSAIKVLQWRQQQALACLPEKPVASDVVDMR